MTGLRQLRAALGVYKTIRRQREGLVIRIRMYRLGPTVHRGQRLEGRPRDVIEGILRRQGIPRRLDMGPQHESFLARQNVAMPLFEFFGPFVGLKNLGGGWVSRPVQRQRG